MTITSRFSYSNPSSQQKGGNEPWRNKERHYCSLCNAWMGSDRQSISLHENGKKHREALEKDLAARREQKAKREKNEKDLESVFAKVNAAVGISVGKSVPASCGVPNAAVLRFQQSQQLETKASSADILTKPSIKPVENSSLDPISGHYEQEGTIYLDGHVYASILEEGMPVQLWTGNVAATDSEKRDLRYSNNWKIALLAKVTASRKLGGNADYYCTNQDRGVSCHVSYLQASHDNHETLESNVSPSRIRLVLGSDPTIPSSIEEAQLALMGGEQTIVIASNKDSSLSDDNPVDIDENTGLSGWTTTSIRKTSSYYETNQEKKRKREHEKELVEYKIKKEREVQARKMEEAKYANAHDSALGAYDVWSSSNSAIGGAGRDSSTNTITNSYKGVDITQEVQLNVADTAKSLAKGMGNVSFKKTTMKKKNNVRRTLADDD